MTFEQEIYMISQNWQKLQNKKEIGMAITQKSFEIQLTCVVVLTCGLIDNILVE